MQILRFADNPIIRPDMDSMMGDNINGPSLIRVPDWLPSALGRYYLYFACHVGTYIRLAYSDRLEGPWKTYEPGTLQLEETPCRTHIASPDVHVDEARREIRMYYHGTTLAGQKTFVAVSGDGIRFRSSHEVLGDSYFRVFDWRGWHYALVMPGTFLRSRDGLSGFETGPTLFGPEMRHSALKLDGNVLTVFHSNAGDCPERILASRIELTDDWMQWTRSEPMTIVEPEMDYEGATLPSEPSRRGLAHGPVRQLRDPAVFRECGRDYLLYSVAGESGIAIAEILP
jgi:hypothetical protein